MLSFGSVLAVLGLGMSLVGAPSHTFTEALPPLHAVTGTAQAQQPLQVLTIGDSIMRGHGLSTTAEAWPALVAAADDWSLTNDGCDGAGVLTAGVASQCGGTDYAGIIAGAAAQHPDIVIIEGSSNDFSLDNSALQAATLSEVQTLKYEFPSAQIVGLSTLWGSTAPQAELAEVNAQVEQAVKDVGGTYIDIGQPMEGHPELMQADDVHPNAAGQAVLATAIQVALAKVNDAAMADNRLAVSRVARVSKLVELGDLQ